MGSITATPAKIVFKIATTAEWDEALRRGAYLGSPDDVRDGFIHLSTGRQLSDTLRKHFRGRTDLILVAIEVQTLGSALKWEMSRGGDLFPHLYAVLPPSAALWIKRLSIGEDGVAVVPEGFEEC